MTQTSDTAAAGVPTAPPESFAETQRRAVLDLRRVVAHRAEAERESRAAHENALAAAERELRDRLAAAAERRQRERSAAERERIEGEERTEAEAAEAQAALEREFSSRLSDARERLEAAQTAAREKLEDRAWMAETVYDAAKNKPRLAHELAMKEIQARREELDEIAARAARIAHLPLPEAAGEAGPEAGMGSGGEAEVGSGVGSDAEAMAGVQRAIAALRRDPFVGARRASLPVVLLILLPILAAPLGLLADPTGVLPSTGARVGAAAGAGLLVGLAIALPLRAAGVRRARRRLADVLHAVAAARGALDRRRAEADRTRDRETRELRERFEAERNEAKRRYEERLQAVTANERRVLEELETARDRRAQEIASRRERRLERVRERAAQRIQAAEEEHRRAEAAAREHHARVLRDAESLREEQRGSIEAEWLRVTAAATDALVRTGEAACAFAPPLETAERDGLEPPLEPAPAIRVGGVRLAAEAFGELPEEPRLLEGRGLCYPDVPAVLDFPASGSLLLETPGGAGRERAIATLRAAMLRLLLSLPPGKARFTIFDPVGLGQSFAGFMHLADYEELLVTSRIWTEERHIEARLAQLTEHMETVIQKYLRSQFPSIEAYNAHAGEIAEPYRFLVVPDFPAGFNAQAAKRLLSIIESGPRCGVYTLIAADPKEKLPPPVTIEALRERSLVLRAEGGGFALADEAYAGLPLTLDAPPEDEPFVRLVKRIGERSRDANRVEVPFRLLAPPEGQLWTRSAADELRVPLGRAGATRHQEIALGKGVSQHALIAGKTGSGKSTLLHVFITNACLWMSPDEVEFYLVDFKKGVEFKAYTGEETAPPHVRAVAIESEREFGLSVLERLDEELRIRGDLFRDAGVQSLSAWRAARPDHPMPRTILVIDEFQELFTEDDRVGQEAALLLDRIVRQGRAFGVHAVLGSQTLSGAYTLARSTMGQMGVRIALQTSEADSYIILSEDNGAARLLTRPGEAIYNDANGMVEGNSPFQIAWLSDARRAQALREVRAKAAEAGTLAGRPTQIVFEGNQAALIRRNDRLRALLSGAEAAPAVPHAWLGEPVAIRPPTAALLRRQAGANLLLVGQQDDAARAMVASALVSLVAQARSTPGARVVVLDGTPEDDPAAGLLRGLAGVLDSEACRVECRGWRDGPDLLPPIAEEVQRRDDAQRVDAPPVFVLICGLQKFRALRSSGDDFSFSFSSDDGPEAEAGMKPDKALTEILRTGPGYGVHVVCWADTAANLERVLDRSARGEFEQKVVLQMSAADSSTLIDSTQASRLGMNRAYLWNQEQGTLEKFRPYAAPDPAWVREALRARPGA